MSESNKDGSVKATSSTFFRQDSSWHQEYWESRIFGALTLIVIGIILFLNTTGVLSWSIWLNLFRYWPLFIVMAGISIILSFNRFTKLLASIISFLIFLFILFSSSLNMNLFALNPGALANSSYQINKEKYTKLDKINLDFNIGIGSFVFDTKENSTNYIDATSKYYSNLGEPQINEKVSNDELNFTFENNKFSNNFGLNVQSPEYNVDYDSNGVKTSFKIKVGAGKGDVTLNSTKLKGIDAEVGVGELIMSLDKNTTVDNTLKLKAGIGSIKLYLSKDVGYSIDSKAGIGSVKVDGTTLSGKQSGYKSQNYSNAENKIVIDAEVGIGSIEIITR